MSAANTSETFSTKSNDDSVKTFATLSFSGDDLDPDEISRILEMTPTKAYRKGEKFSPGSRSPELIGKTGIWYYSTRRKLCSANPSDHLDKIVGMIFPFADGDRRFRRLRDVMKNKALQARLTVFWRGPSGMAMPPDPPHIARQLGRLPAAIERDFDTL
ncbi:MAG TPA: DUF4279 domain-containing protein [Stellaceae bacterium]|jgi:hypothetical protein